VYDWFSSVGAVAPTHFFLASFHLVVAKMGCCSCEDIVLCIVAIFISPLAVLIKKGCGMEFLINLILFILFVIPGIIHAWFVILSWKHFERCLLTLVCLIGLSPIAVFIRDGCAKCFWVNLLLWILGVIPGMIHGIWFVWWGKGDCF